MTNFELAEKLKRSAERVERWQIALEYRNNLLNKIRADRSLSHPERTKLEVIAYSLYNQYVSN